jgi:heme exporter protein A
VLFEGLDLDIGPGDALHVAGPNGSGKSSLIRLAAGLLRADVGEIRRSPLALADDNVALDREMPLRRALGFWVRNPHEAIAAVGLREVSDAPVRWLSSGQLKRATIARVVGSGAPLWLLDEPLNALDAEGARLLSALVDRHRASGGAILAASHQLMPGDWRRLELQS